MIYQLAIGTALILTSTLIAGIGFLLLEHLLTRSQAWLLRPPHALKLLFLLNVAIFWILIMVTVAVWIWALAYYALGIFITIEAAVYFSIVSFTTLGFGDILLPYEWRLLSGMAAMNGLLMIGFLTAMLVEVLRRVRSIQAETRDWTS